MPTEPAVLSNDTATCWWKTYLLPSARIDSVNLLRGLVMVLMVLDHTRDFFGDATFNPTDLSRATTALFMTRWVTHFCAPVFAFLAGSGAYLAGSRGRSRASLAWFLATRGLWLIFLELTVVNLGLYFNPLPSVVFLLVFWSIGGSFVLLSSLVWLPARVIGLALGVLIVAAHNLIDVFSLSPGSLGRLQPLAVLLRPGGVPLPAGATLLFGYPLIPWFGVVAAGYGFGEIIRLESERRRSITLGIGLALIALFILAAVFGRLWRSEPVDNTEDAASDGTLVLELHEASTVLALCRDDAWARASGSGGF